MRNLYWKETQKKLPVRTTMATLECQRAVRIDELLEPPHS